MMAAAAGFVVIAEVIFVAVKMDGFDDDNGLRFPYNSSDSVGRGRRP